MEKQDCAAIAREVLAAAGGVENVESVRACLPRLRLVARRASSTRAGCAGATSRRGFGARRTIG